jgi:hypothetical protein
MPWALGQDAVALRPANNNTGLSADSCLAGEDQLRRPPPQELPLDRVVGHRGGLEVRGGRLAISDLLRQRCMKRRRMATGEIDKPSDEENEKPLESGRIICSLHRGRRSLTRSQRFFSLRQSQP